MADAGFFRGTSAAQDSRFSDKEKKMMKQMKFADSLVKKVDMPRVKLDVIKPWITRRVTEMLGAEDEVLIEFVFNQLEEKNLNPRKMQINLTGFLNGKNARVFMQELWDLLCSASANPNGIPDSFIEEKKEEIKKRNEEQARQELLIGRQLEAERQRVEHQLSCAVRQPSPVTEERRSRHRASPAPGPGGDGLSRSPRRRSSSRERRAEKRRRSPSERSVSPPEGVKKSSRQDTAEVRKSRSKAKKTADRQRGGR
ncbi:Serine/arginine repetitive matrix protein 1 [Amphibalanus amphitrite]|uniref:Serine/arginine repetitive matrix protein 1 n=1 Tax=Amphibalanus amphitrite TaxID=1232801 RepID=A0A6A4V9V5_AMPAM|nr:Serine/arginine repetitive matrix protein 1 [Amphibalanus amphitrite]